MRRLARLAPLFLLVGVVPAGADMPAPPDRSPHKYVTATIELDWGPFADRVSRRHVVAKGETLSSIARSEAGDVARWKTIAEANPEVASDPSQLKVGAVLWIPPPRAFDPPRAASAPAPTPVLDGWYDALWVEWRYDVVRNVERGAWGPVPDGRKRGGLLVLAPHARAMSLLAAAEKQEPIRIDALGDGVLKASLFPNTRAHRDDPTVRVHCRFTLGAPEGPLVRVSETISRFDATGMAVTKFVEAPAPDYGFERTPSALAGGTTPARDAVPAGSGASASARWPTSTGLLVAGAGLALILAVWRFSRRRGPPAA